MTLGYQVVLLNEYGAVLRRVPDVYESDDVILVDGESYRFVRQADEDGQRVRYFQRASFQELGDELIRAMLERAWDEGFHATVPGWSVRSAFSGTTPTDTEHAAAHRQRKEAIDRLMAENASRE